MGPVCRLASATWIWSGELTAQGNQEQSLIDRPVWAIYFPSIEQPMLGWVDLPVDQAASLMGARPGTVKRYLHLAHRSLKGRLS